MESRNPYRVNAEDQLEFTYNLGKLPLVIPERAEKQEFQKFEELKK